MKTRKTLDAFEVRRKTDESQASAGSPGDALPSLPENQKNSRELRKQDLSNTQPELTTELTAYAELFDFAPISYFTLDKNGVISRANHAASKLLGIQREKLIGKNLVGFVTAADQPVFEAFLKRMFATKADAGCEIKLERADQSQLIVRFMAAVSADGRECRAILDDITGIKQGEAAEHDQRTLAEALRDTAAALNSTLELEEVLDRILDNVGRVAHYDVSYIMLVDKEQQIARAVRQRDSRTPNREKALDPIQFSIPQTRNLREMQATGAPFIIPDTKTEPDWIVTPYTAWIRSNLSVPIKNKSEIIGFLGLDIATPNSFTELDTEHLKIFADQAAIAIQNAQQYAQQQKYAAVLEQSVAERTAELQLANLDLARSARMKDEFIASVSHELRTPLTGILGLAQILQLETYGPLNEKQITALGHIETSGQKLLQMINDILDLALLDIGKIEPRIEPCSLEEICQSSMRMVKSSAKKKHPAGIGFSISPVNIIVKADARRLKQILVNLLNNAIKFTPQGGSLGIDVRAQYDSNSGQGIQTGKQVKITVWDTGIGIQPQDIPRLFQKFVQIDGGLSRRYSGTGLGLALVQRLAKLLGGHIEVESIPAKGSRFSLILPCE